MSDNELMQQKLQQVSEKYSNKLKLVHINAQSLNSSEHYSEFQHVFSNSNIDIIAVSETFYQEHSKTQLPNYVIFNVNRVERSGGGVAIYVHNKLKARILSKSSGEKGKPEYVIIEVKSGNDKILVSCLYRPPKIGFLQTFLDEIYSFLPNYNYSVMCGDFNARFGSGSYESKLVSELFELCAHTCVPFAPTYHTEYCNSTLDIIASNFNDKIVEYGQCSAPGFSNHDMIYSIFSMEVPPTKEKIIKYRDFKNIDLDSLRKDAMDTPWHEIYECEDIDTKVQTFNGFIRKLMEKHSPIKTFKAKNNSSPWMDGEISKLINERDKARLKAKKSKTPGDYSAFKMLRNKTKQEIRNAKLRYYHDIFKDNPSPGKLWNGIRSLGIGRSNQSNSTVDFPVSANELNEHYLSVSRIENEELAKEAESGYSTQYDFDKAFHFKFVTAHEIHKIIQGIKSNAVGPDGVTMKFLRLILNEVKYALEHIFNYCLQSGVFPSEWKCANVVPIPKVTNPNNCADFRPVSILCVLAKALEKIVHDQLYDYAEVNELFNPLQSGFRKGHSTVTALVKVADDIRKSIDDRKMTLLVLLDFSKAFDRVNHKLLVVKLKKLGCSVFVLKWFQAYLTNRKQRVKSGDEFISSWAPVETGVPQGSVLGPLLFILYLYDISSVLKNTKYHLYADDTQIYKEFSVVEVTEAVDKVNEDLASLVDYVSRHNLCLNEKKTQPIIIGSGQYVNILKNTEVPQVRINNLSVPYCEEVKNLGVTFDCTLSWRQQVNSVVRKVFSALAQARRNFDYLPRSIRHRIVQSLIMPLIDYGTVIYTDLSKELCQKVQKAENACVRFITKSSRYERITPHYKGLKMLKSNERRNLALTSLMWKVMKFNSPRYLRVMFTPSARHCNKLTIPIHRTTKYTNSFRVSSCRIYNHHNIHNYLHHNTSLSLKATVKSYLFDKYV